MITVTILCKKSVYHRTEEYWRALTFMKKKQRNLITIRLLFSSTLFDFPCNLWWRSVELRGYGETRGEIDDEGKQDENKIEEVLKISRQKRWWDIRLFLIEKNWDFFEIEGEFRWNQNDCIHYKSDFFWEFLAWSCFCKEVRGFSRSRPGKASNVGSPQRNSSMTINNQLQIIANQ